MRPAGPLAAERRAALHSEALFTQHFSEDDRNDGIARMTRTAAAGCAEDLRKLTGLPVRCESEIDTGGAQLGPSETEEAQHVVFTLGRPRATLRLVVQPHGIDGVVENLFGGVPDLPGRQAPAADTATSRLSARLMQQRITACLKDAVLAAIAPTGLDCREVETWRQDRQPSRGRQVAVAINLRLAGLGPETVHASLALTQDARTVLSVALASGTTAMRQARSPDTKPFAGIGLPLRAVLSETHMPLSRIAALAPGDVLPLPIRRRVPLMCGETPIAWGTLGQMDDCAALRIANFETHGGNA